MNNCVPPTKKKPWTKKDHLFVTGGVVITVLVFCLGVWQLFADAH